MKNSRPSSKEGRRAGRKPGEFCLEAKALSCSGECEQSSSVAYQPNTNGFVQNKNRRCPWVHVLVVCELRAQVCNL